MLICVAGCEGWRGEEFVDRMVWQRDCFGKEKVMCGVDSSIAQRRCASDIDGGVHLRARRARCRREISPLMA